MKWHQNSKLYLSKCLRRWSSLGWNQEIDPDRWINQTKISWRCVTLQSHVLSSVLNDLRGVLFAEAPDRFLSICTGSNVLQQQVQRRHVYIEPQPAGCRLITVNEWDNSRLSVLETDIQQKNTSVQWTWLSYCKGLWWVYTCDQILLPRYDVIGTLKIFQYDAVYELFSPANENFVNVLIYY